MYFLIFLKIAPLLDGAEGRYRALMESFRDFILTSPYFYNAKERGIVK